MIASAARAWAGLVTLVAWPGVARAAELYRFPPAPAEAAAPEGDIGAPDTPPPDPGSAPAAAAAASASASAAPVVVVEGRGFYKPFASWLVMPPSVIDATRELARAFDEARAALPPEQAGALPASVVVPEHIGLSTHTVRVWSTVRIVELVELNAAWQGAAVIASSPLFVAGASGVFGASQAAPERRLVDFDPLLLSDGGFALQHNLDQLNVALHTSSVSVIVGRQVVSWGSGRLWNPTDLFSPFAPTDVDREVRRGADAARVSLALGETTELDLLWLPQDELAKNGAVVRARTNVLDVDGSLTVAKYVTDFVVGADVAGDAGPCGLHAEAAWTLPLEHALTGAGFDVDALALDDSFVRAVAGVSVRPAESWLLMAEYYFNGFGAERADEYLRKLRSDRVARGEVFGAGRHYVGVASSWALSDLTTLGTTAIVNVLDPSAIFVIAAEHSFDQHVLLRAGANVPFGAGVDASLFRTLTGADVLTGSAAFERATTTFGARHEYGLSPFSLFVQLGAYFG